MLVVEGMAPIGTGLHEPVLSCWPLVMGSWGSVAHQLIKLLVDVSEATPPASNVTVFKPSCARFGPIREDRRVKEVWAPLEPAPDGAVGDAVGVEDML